MSEPYLSLHSAPDPNSSSRARRLSSTQLNAWECLDEHLTSLHQGYALKSSPFMPSQGPMSPRRAVGQPPCEAIVPGFGVRVRLDELERCGRSLHGRRDGDELVEFPDGLLEARGRPNRADSHRGDRVRNAREDGERRTPHERSPLSRSCW